MPGPACWQLVQTIRRAALSWCTRRRATALSEKSCSDTHPPPHTQAGADNTARISAEVQLEPGGIPKRGATIPRPIGEPALGKIWILKSASVRSEDFGGRECSECGFWRSRVLGMWILDDASLRNVDVAKSRVLGMGILQGRNC